MDVAKLCFAFLGVALLIFIVRAINEKYAVIVSFAASMIFFGHVIKLFTPIYDELKAISSLGVDPTYVSIMLKSLFIAGITRFASELCRDCGENGIASKIEVFGKLGIVSLSLPLLRTILDIINDLV